MYVLKILPQVDRIFKKLMKKDKNQLNAINKKIEELLKNPEIGKPLHFPLQNMRRVRIMKSFVLIYSINKKENTLAIVEYGHHDNIYK